MRSASTRFRASRNADIPQNEGKGRSELETMRCEHSSESEGGRCRLTFLQDGRLADLGDGAGIEVLIFLPVIHGCGIQTAALRACGRGRLRVLGRGYAQVESKVVRRVVVSHIDDETGQVVHKAACSRGRCLGSGVGVVSSGSNVTPPEARPTFLTHRRMSSIDSSKKHIITEMSRYINFHFQK